ncbi:MAG: 7-cyano-7-deazaguanine synthase [Candidatus Aenigmatarchaeota archaeon]
MKVVTLLSGGVDSTVLLYYLKTLPEVEEMKSLTIDYKQKHWREILSARKISKRAGIDWKLFKLKNFGEISQSFLTSEGESFVVPGRNLVFISLAVAYASSINFDYVAISATKDDEQKFLDCRKEFLQKLSEATKTAYNVGLLFPFVEKSKVDLVNLAKQLKVPLHLTYSCYNGGKRQCGECLACQKNLEAFRQNDLDWYKIFKVKKEG